MRYQAAGAFEERLDWKPLLADAAAQTTSNRLIATLEAFLRHASSTGRVVEFDNLLEWILDAARRGERGDAIAGKIRLRLATMIPSVVIHRATKPSLPDPTRGARFFGFDFSCQRPLTTADRRLLRASAQLLSIVSGSPDTVGAPPPLDFKPPETPDATVIAYSVADWQAMCHNDQARAQHDPWLRTA